MTTKLTKADVFSVLVTISGDPENEGHVIPLEAIEVKDAVWLVIGWIEVPGGKLRQPRRIICPPPSALKRAEVKIDPTVRYSLQDPVPITVIEGPAEKQHGYTVVDRPDILVEFVLH